MSAKDDLPPGEEPEETPRSESNKNQDSSSHHSRVPKLHSDSNSSSDNPHQNTPPAEQNNLEFVQASGESSFGSRNERTFKIENRSITCPAKIGEYEILDIIGSGGMGNVFKVRNEFSDAIQALKMIKPFDGSLQSRDSFVREMKTQAKLEHPNILKVHFAGRCKINGGYHHYFVMPLEDSDLGKEIKKTGQFDQRRAADIVRKLASAMSVAHAQKVFHCDLKPQNILMDQQGVPKVADFGLAKLQTDEKATSLGSLPGNPTRKHGKRPIGTPSYAPPEQANGDISLIDARSDIYGLGAILYEMLTGKPPFFGTSTTETLFKVQFIAPEPIRNLNPKVHPQLEAICLKCLKKDREDRFKSASELEEKVEKFLKPNWLNRNLFQLILASLILLLVGSISLLAFDNLSKPQREKRILLDGLNQEIAKLDDDLIDLKNGRTLVDLRPREKITSLEKIYEIKNRLSGEKARKSSRLETRELATFLNLLNSKCLGLSEGIDESPDSLIPTIEAFVVCDKRISAQFGISDVLDSSVECRNLVLTSRVLEMRMRRLVALRRWQFENYEDSLSALSDEGQMSDESMGDISVNELPEELTKDVSADILMLIKLEDANKFHLMGMIYDSKHEYKAAEGYYRTSIDIRNKLDPDPKDYSNRSFWIVKRHVARGFAYLGDSFAKNKQYREAEDAYDKARDIRSKLALAESAELGEKCLHARDFGNAFTLLNSKNQDVSVLELVKELRKREMYCQNSLREFPVLPEEYKYERIDWRIRLVDCLFNLSDDSVSEYKIHEEASELLISVENEMKLLLKNDSLIETSQDFYLMNGEYLDSWMQDSQAETPNKTIVKQRILIDRNKKNLGTRSGSYECFRFCKSYVKYILAKSRWLLRSDRLKSRFLYTEIVRRELDHVESWLIALDECKKAGEENYYLWAETLALKMQVSESASNFDVLYSLVEDRLSKAIRMGFSEISALRRDKSFDVIRFSGKYGRRFENFCEQCKSN